MKRTDDHGLAMYERGSCKCQVCRDANAIKYRKERASRYYRLLADPTLRPHGVRNTYHNWGCRCDPCCDAMGKPRGTPPPDLNSDIRPTKHRKRIPQPERVRGQQNPRRRMLMYEYGGNPQRHTAPFGREWLREAV